MKPPVVEVTPPVVEVTPPVVEAKPPVVEAKPPAVEAKPPVVEVTPPVVEAKPPVVEAKPPVAEVVCPFCGGCFAPQEARGPCAPCGGCTGGGLWKAFKKSCALVCPRCGYAVFAPGGPSAPGASTPAPRGAVPLRGYPLHQRARVVCLEADESSLRKLLTLGILPGTVLEVERRRPCYLCKVGRAQLAFDEQLAACIQVVAA